MASKSPNELLQFRELAVRYNNNNILNGLSLRSSKKKKKKVLKFQKSSKHAKESSLKKRLFFLVSLYLKIAITP